MKRGKIQIILYSILSIVVSGFLLLVLVSFTIFPIVRRYTIVNETNHELYVTPLMQFGAGYIYNDLDDTVIRQQYIEEVENFSVLNQFCFFSWPAIPAFITRDIKVGPNSSKVIFIDFDDLKQELGPQILLVKNTKGEHTYLEADFWSGTTIEDLALIHKAPINLIQAKNDSDSTLTFWLFIITMLTLIMTFPALLVKTVIKYKKEKSLLNSMSYMNDQVHQNI